MNASCLLPTLGFEKIAWDSRRSWGYIPLFKIVDLLAAKTPDLALSYPALYELLPHGRGGYHFSSVDDLANQLTHLLMPKEDFEGVGDAPDLARCRRYIQQMPTQSWHAHWLETVYPVVVDLLSIRPKKRTE